MSQANGRVVVIGGGAIGAACGYYLAEAGRPVTVIDRGEFGKACSHANCGYVCPSHVLPLAGPGAARRALAAMMKPGAPFSIRPRASLALWRWLLAFRKRCNRRDMLAAGKAIQALLDSSRALYGELASSGQIDAEFQTKGLLFVLQSAAAMEHFAEVDRLQQEEFGAGARRIEGEALARFEPALKDGLAGGWHYPGDAHLRPDKLMSSFRRLLESRGVEIREHCQFHDFEKSGDRAAQAIASQAGSQVKLEADLFVVAAGAWTGQMSRELGCKIPIQPGKGYSLTMARPATCPQVPLIFEEHRVAVTPFESGYRLGSIMEFAGYDSSLKEKKLDLLRRGAAHYLREPLGPGEQIPWQGWRPMTPDSLPLIGRTPKFSNVFLAAGHNMLGVSMAPATGRLMAELICGAAPHLDPAPYAPRRF